MSDRTPEERLITRFMEVSGERDKLAFKCVRLQRECGMKGQRILELERANREMVEILSPLVRATESPAKP